jgi:hypothetical protein
VALLPGLRLIGNVAPETENPAPDTVAESIVNALVPFDVTVTDPEAEEPTDTLPNCNEVGLRDKAGLTAYRVKEKVFVTEPAIAERVTDSVEVTLTA